MGELPRSYNQVDDVIMLAIVAYVINEFANGYNLVRHTGLCWTGGELIVNYAHRGCAII